MVSLRCSCSCNSSTSECDSSRYLVLPPSATDDDETHEAFRTSLYQYLGIEISTASATSSWSAQAGASAPPPGNKKPSKLLRICCCLCADCIRVNCGVWLDALRVQHASDSELYFFQTHLQHPQKTTDDNTDAAATAVTPNSAAAAASSAPVAETRKRKTGYACFRGARGRIQGSIGEAWGLLASCSGPFSFRHCLTIMQQPPELWLRNSQGNWEPATAAAAGTQAAADAAAYASQAHRLFALFCAPANEVRQYTPEKRQTTILRDAAADMKVYIHPKVQVASFEREGRGLVAAEELKRGEVLLRIPASALLNVYTALMHPTFSPLAQVLLGLPPERLLQQGAAAQQKQQQQQTKPQQQQQIPTVPTELQPLVDSDVVLCLFLLFLAFTAGEQGGRALLRFLPSAGEADAAETAAAVWRSSASDAAAAEAEAAATAARKEEMLLVDSEGVVEFLGDAALASAINRSEAKCKMMQQQLLPLLLQTFPPPPGMQQGGGVLSACRAAAAAAANANPKIVVREACMPASGAVAAAAAAAAGEGKAQAGCACGAALLSSCERLDLLKAFLAHLNYTDFLWAHLVLESRSFSLPLGPLGPLKEFKPPAGPLGKPSESCGKEASGGPIEGPVGGPPGGSTNVNKGGDNDEEEEQEEDADEEEERRVPFLLELLETRGAEECRCVLLPVGLEGGPQAFEGPLRETAAPEYFVRLPLRCASFVPLGDLLNHHFHAQVLSPSIEEEGRSLCLRLACDVPAGAQVYAHYGPLQSWQFLAFFGFCPSSFYRLQPPQVETAADKTGEWQFTAEANGNPVDFVTVQVAVPEDDAEYELKSGIIDLQQLPLCGVFSTGVEGISCKFLASLFVSSHASLDHFLCAGGAGAAAAAAVATAAATAAGEMPWGPTYTFTAVNNDPEAAARIREIITDALQSVAKAAEDRKRCSSSLHSGAAASAAAAAAATEAAATAPFASTAAIM